MPPPVYDAFKDLSPDLYDSGLTAVLETVRGAVRMKRAAVVTRAQTMQSTEEIDSDSDADDDVFSTDFTLDLLTQLEDVLIISIAQNWQIFEPKFVPSTNVGTIIDWLTVQLLPMNLGDHDQLLVVID